ncbi:Peptidase M23 [Thermodesulfatator indicus DSM 15286]|uniref:Peptidase M23 n=1 Tax=Thermodesulfatator indicus (strain DSM 15286 / JCM 11887 / CIR29812) TaxID=667014 RepID=F8AB76_THEID|nr:M23 family metallopeptidase [Thermodesulfatator indicus]AEH45532.1 Peptidase M23 [Thermodesulfatator indicus DSM 15286]
MPQKNIDDKNSPSWLKGNLCPLIIICLLLLSAILFYQNIRLRIEVKELRGKVASLETEIVSLRLREKELETQIDELEKEKEELLNQAVGALRQYDRYVKKVVRQLGLSHHFKVSSNKAVGGPYLPPKKEYEILINQISTYLLKFDKIPIGKPVRGYISSYYGYRRDPFTKKRAFHSGIDIVARYGAPVRATADGVVYRVGYTRALGRYVKIRHAHGFMTVYGHLRKYVVKRGERVQKGEIIGYVGNTGRSTGPHVHYEIRRWGRSLNPLRFVRAEKKLAKITSKVKTSKTVYPKETKQS